MLVHLRRLYSPTMLDDRHHLPYMIQRLWRMIEAPLLCGLRDLERFARRDERLEIVGEEIRRPIYAALEIDRLVKDEGVIILLIALAPQRAGDSL